MDARSDHHWDACLMWPIGDRCNLSCVYCFESSMLRKAANKLSQVGFLGTLRMARHFFATEMIRGPRPVNPAVLMDALERTNKTFLLHLSGGGEPFLVGNIIDLCAEITKKHCISFNTNLTSEKIGELCERVDPRKIVSIYASLHIKELERLGLTDRFIENFHLCRRNGIPIVATEVAFPGLLGEVERYREQFGKRGVDFVFTTYEGVFEGREYPGSYTERELDLFGIRDEDSRHCYHSRGRLCNAGYNIAFICQNGTILPCWCAPDPLGDIRGGFQFRDGLMRCPSDHCRCPMYTLDKTLFERALKETGIENEIVGVK